MASEGKKRRKKRAREPEPEAPVEDVEQPAAPGPAEAKMRRPVIPLLWLLLPFFVVLGYGLLTR